MEDRSVAPGALKAARQARNITLRQLAATARISSGYLSDLEAGLKGGSADVHVKLATALQVSVNEITYDITTHHTCPTCGGRGVVPNETHTPSGAAA